MKTIKSILIAATLIGSALVSGLSAQEAAKPTFNVELGDTVMIKRECERYLTGEVMSLWVYDRFHIVGQLGTKRFPEGVMLDNGNGGILSWVCQECIGPVTPKEEAKPEPAPAPEPAPEPEPEPEPEPAPAPEPAPEPQPIDSDVDNGDNSGNIAVAEEEEEPVKEKKARSGYDRFTIGVRGGASSLLHKTEIGKWTCGFDAILDLQYAHYWTKEGRPVDLGIIAGIGVGYAQSGLKTAVDDAYTQPTDYGNIDYTIKADEVKESDGQIQLEVPVMFSLIHESGLFFNVGPKFMIPVFTPYNQAISNNENTVVDAYFPERDVHVTNDLVTGVLGDDQYKLKGTDNGNQFKINVMLTAEIGYEWILKSGNSLGLGAFANYSVFSTFNKKDTVKDPIVSLATPPSDASEAKFDVNAATKSYASKLGFFDAGIKLAYHFNFPKKEKPAKAEESELAPVEPAE